MELAWSTRCFTSEDVSGKGEAPDTGADMGPSLGMSFPRQPLCSTDECVEAVVLICSKCGQDLRAEGSRLLLCQHLLCKDCFQGFMRELGHVTRAYRTTPGGKYESLMVRLNLQVRPLPVS